MYFIFVKLTEHPVLPNDLHRPALVVRFCFVVSCYPHCVHHIIIEQAIVSVRCLCLVVARENVLAWVVDLAVLGGIYSRLRSPQVLLGGGEVGAVRYRWHVGVGGMSGGGGGRAAASRVGWGYILGGAA